MLTDFSVYGYIYIYVFFETLTYLIYTLSRVCLLVSNK